MKSDRLSTNRLNHHRIIQHAARLFTLYYTSLSGICTCILQRILHHRLQNTLQVFAVLVISSATFSASPRHSRCISSHVARRSSSRPSASTRPSLRAMIRSAHRSAALDARMSRGLSFQVQALIFFWRLNTHNQPGPQSFGYAPQQAQAGSAPSAFQAGNIGLLGAHFARQLLLRHPLLDRRQATW